MTAVERPEPAPLSVETLMSEMRLRVREGMGWSRDVDGPAYDEVKRVFQAAHEALVPGAPFYPQVLGAEEEWEVPTPLAFETHRGWLGQGLIRLKRHVLFPLNRWLHSYVWHNLQRQQRLNLRLLAAVEALAVSHARLRSEVEALRRGSAADDSPTEAPAISSREVFSDGSGPRPMPVMKLAFVVDRYGPDVPGGAERHCRDFALRLAERGHEVTVLTTCARDYVTWANAFPPGEEMDGRVTVRRFPVSKERDLEAWHSQSRRVFAGLGSPDDEQRWFELSGPYAPALVDHLRTNKDRHDLFIFFSYRYYPTFAGLPVVAPRAILVPTAEEDPAMRIGALRAFFSLPLGIIHNTIEEHHLIRSVTRGPFPAFAVIGSGVNEGRAPADSESVLARLGVRKSFVLCLGRVDANKGSLTLLSHFQRYRERDGDRVQLVMAGHAAAAEEIPAQPGVRFVGHVTEDERAALLHHMLALVAPSPFESLSLALLEAWTAGRPAIVNGWCKVLRGQVTRANGGLYYDNAAEFSQALRYLIDHPEQGSRLGAQGRARAQAEYAWPRVMEKLEGFLRERLEAAVLR